MPAWLVVALKPDYKPTNCIARSQSGWALLTYFDHQQISKSSLNWLFLELTPGKVLLVQPVVA